MLIWFAYSQTWQVISSINFFIQIAWNFEFAIDMSEVSKVILYVVYYQKKDQKGKVELHACCFFNFRKKWRNICARVFFIDISTRFFFYFFIRKVLLAW